jgi:hypothetical protein
MSSSQSAAVVLLMFVVVHPRRQRVQFKDPVGTENPSRYVPLGHGISTPLFMM